MVGIAVIDPDFLPAVTALKVDTLRTCDLDFAAGNRLPAPAAATMGLEVYVPVDEST